MSAQEAETLQSEWRRHESVMRSIADPTTPEGIVAKRAFDRITELAAELGFDQSIVELGHQVCHMP